MLGGGHLYWSRILPGPRKSEKWRSKYGDVCTYARAPSKTKKMPLMVWNWMFFGMRLLSRRRLFEAGVKTQTSTKPTRMTGTSSSDTGILVTTKTTVINR